MKNYALPILLCVLFGYSSNAQKFTLLPQIGHEASKTLLSYNNLASFAPRCNQLAPSLGLRLDYAFKKVGGPYVGLATSRSTVAVDFSEPENGMNIVNTSTGKMQLRLEGGYKISTKPIYFNKSNKSSIKPPVAPQVQNTTKSRCGGYCSRYRSMKSAPVTTTAAPAGKGWSVSIQPAVGMAFIPAVKSNVSIQSQGNKSGISYVAGNWNSAVTAGVGLEFGNNDVRKFMVSVQYLKGIGNLNTETVSTFSGSKATTTNLSSSVSGINVSVGIPISLSKKKPVVKPVVEKPVEQKTITPERRCGRYYSLYQ